MIFDTRMAQNRVIKPLNLDLDAIFKKKTSTDKADPEIPAAYPQEDNIMHPDVPEIPAAYPQEDNIMHPDVPEIPAAYPQEDNIMHPDVPEIPAAYPQEDNIMHPDVPEIPAAYPQEDNIMHPDVPEVPAAYPQEDEIMAPIAEPENDDKVQPAKSLEGISEDAKEGKADKIIDKDLKEIDEKQLNQQEHDKYVKENQQRDKTNATKEDVYTDDINEIYLIRNDDAKGEKTTRNTVYRSVSKGRKKFSPELEMLKMERILHDESLYEEVGMPGPAKITLREQIEEAHDNAELEMLRQTILQAWVDAQRSPQVIAEPEAPETHAVYPPEDTPMPREAPETPAEYPLEDTPMQREAPETPAEYPLEDTPMPREMPETPSEYPPEDTIDVETKIEIPAQNDGEEKEANVDVTVQVDIIDVDISGMYCDKIVQVEKEHIDNSRDGDHRDITKTNINKEKTQYINDNEDQTEEIKDEGTNDKGVQASIKKEASGMYSDTEVQADLDLEQMILEERTDKQGARANTNDENTKGDDNYLISTKKPEEAKTQRIEVGVQVEMGKDFSSRYVKKIEAYLMSNSIGYDDNQGKITKVKMSKEQILIIKAMFCGNVNWLDEYLTPEDEDETEEIKGSMEPNKGVQAPNNGVSGIYSDVGVQADLDLEQIILDIRKENENAKVDANNNDEEMNATLLAINTQTAEEMNATLLAINTQIAEEMNATLLAINTQTAEEMNATLLAINTQTAEEMNATLLAINTQTAEEMNATLLAINTQTAEITTTAADGKDEEEEGKWFMMMVDKISDNIAIDRMADIMAEGKDEDGKWLMMKWPPAEEPTESAAHPTDQIVDKMADNIADDIGDRMADTPADKMAVKMADKEVTKIEDEAEVRQLHPDWLKDLQIGNLPRLVEKSADAEPPTEAENVGDKPDAETADDDGAKPAKAPTRLGKRFRRFRQRVRNFFRRGPTRAQ